jgi:hypothetical protein
MNKTIYLLFFLSVYQSSIAQLNALNNPNSSGAMDFTDQEGKSLIKKYDPEIRGTPFVKDGWLQSKITLSKGKEITTILTKFNLESTELYFKDDIGNEMIAIEGLVKRIDFYNTKSKDGQVLTFKNGYPAIDKQNVNFYYKLLTEGSIELIEKKIKYVRVQKDEYTGQITRDFVESASTFYIFTNNKMQVFKPSKKKLLALTNNKAEKMNKSIENKKINYKKLSDVIDLFNYYNQLVISDGHNK